MFKGQQWYGLTNNPSELVISERKTHQLAVVQVH